MSVETGGSTTTPNSKLVGKTGDLLLRGLMDTYKGGVDTYNKPLYTGPGDITRGAWWSGNDFGNALYNNAGFGTGQRAAQDSLGGVFSGFGTAGDRSSSQLGSVFSGYGQLADNNGLTGAQSSAMTRNAGLGTQYAGLGTAYDPNSAAYKTLRQGIVDDTLSNLGSQFTASGRFGGGSYIDTAAEGLGDALAGLDYTNMQNNINNKYRSLDAQRGVFGDQFNMGQTGVGNQMGALAGQAGTANSMFGNTAAALSGQAGVAGQQFGMGQQALDNQTNAINMLGQIGAQQDASTLASRMADYDLSTRKNDADWEALARASSILGGTAGASGSTTSNTVPWWAALLGGAATGASIFG